MSALRDQLWAVAATVFAVVAVYFFRFYRDTKDRFFVLFGLAFVVFSLQYTALSAWAIPDEARHWLYLVRLLGFALIVIAIADKNRKAG